MTESEVFALLDAERDERGIAHWQRLGAATGNLRSYGIGLTKLRKMARQVGRDHALARALWKSDAYEARVLALLVDDPARITREQAEAQVEQLAGGMVAHVCASCEAFFQAHVEHIAARIATAPEKVRMAMGAALMGIGKRSAVLNRAALEVARATGPIEFTSASGDCEPFDVVKHLASERLMEKLGLSA